MRVTTWGCRGSLASPGPTKDRYGGDTTCVEVRLDDDTLIVLDAGTGIRALGEHLDEVPDEVHLLLTHLHMDHIEGFPFFPGVWDPDCRLHIWGPPSTMFSLRERVRRYMSPPLFPIDVDDVPSNCTFHDLPTRPWNIGSATLLASRIEHPGETVGFRLEEGGGTFAFMPDHEPAVLGDFRSETPDWIDGYAVAEGADVLLHDAQYTSEEYVTRRGWGHSSTDDAVAYAQVTGVRQLVLFHHDPSHSDDFLEEMEAHASELWGDAPLPPKLAAAERPIEIPATSPVG